MNRSKSLESQGLWLGLALIVLATATRLLPHAANFTAMGAVALFAGYLFRNHVLGLVVVLCAMLISDALIGFDSIIMRVVVYASLVVPVGLGVLLRNRATPRQWLKTIGLGLATSLCAGLFFFATTNLAVWASSGMYTLDMAGLALCFTNAIPFYKTALAGDVVYSLALFGTYCLCMQLVYAANSTFVRKSST